MQFVLRVAHTKAGGDRKRRDARRLSLNGGTRCHLVQFTQGHAASVVATGQGNDSVRTQHFDQPTGLNLRRVISGQQHTDRRPLAFHDRVGSKRGGQRHHIDQRQHAGRQFVERPANADRQIETRSQTLGGSHHLFAAVQQHRVGERATRVYAQKKMHFAHPCKFCVDPASRPGPIVVPSP